MDNEVDAVSNGLNLKKLGNKIMMLVPTVVGALGTVLEKRL